MNDVLIRDVPDDVLAALDQLAARVGLPRTEYIRRRLAQDARAARTAATRDDWRRLAATCGDLADPAMTDRAWE